jgi:protein gp37
VPQSSAIEWTEATWNPVTGCSEVSPGCAHCYAKTFAERWRGIPSIRTSKDSTSGYGQNALRRRCAGGGRAPSS